MRRKANLTLHLIAIQSKINTNECTVKTAHKEGIRALRQGPEAGD